MVYLKVNKILHFLLLYVNMIHLKLFKRILKLCEQDVYDINAITSFDKMTSLHYICQDGKINLLKLFIQFEKDRPNVIDLNIQNFNGMATLLLDEKENNEIDPFSFEANQEKVICVSLCNAEGKCDLPVKAKNGFDRGMTLLHYACKGSNVEIVKLLLKHAKFNINLKANGKSCLYYACRNNAQITELLLHQDDINVNGKTPTGISPLMLACESKNKKIVEMILQHPNVDVDDMTINGDSAKGYPEDDPVIFRLLNKYSLSHPNND